MRSHTLNAWGLLVGNVCRTIRETCQYVSPVCGFAISNIGTNGYNPLLIQIPSFGFTSSTPQAVPSYYSLLEAYFYPLSTAPITTNVMKGLKK